MRFVDEYGPRAPLEKQYGGHGLLTLLARPNLTTSFRVVRCGGNGSRAMLWDCPCRVAVRRPYLLLVGIRGGLRVRHICCADLRLERVLGLVNQYIYDRFAELLGSARQHVIVQGHRTDMIIMGLLIPVAGTTHEY
jgi:hypothetical protein